MFERYQTSKYFRIFSVNNRAYIVHQMVKISSHEENWYEVWHYPVKKLGFIVAED